LMAAYFDRDVKNISYGPVFNIEAGELSVGYTYVDLVVRSRFRGVLKLQWTPARLTWC
jgi:hypothetical protein